MLEVAKRKPLRNPPAGHQQHAATVPAVPCCLCHPCRACGRPCTSDCRPPLQGMSSVRRQSLRSHPQAASEAPAWPSQSQQRLSRQLSNSSSRGSAHTLPTAVGLAPVPSPQQVQPAEAARSHGHPSAQASGQQQQLHQQADPGAGAGGGISAESSGSGAPLQSLQHWLPVPGAGAAAGGSPAGVSRQTLLLAPACPVQCTPL